MPGARSRNFRFGDSSELLAEFILNTIAFTTRVPRQEDVGHDFLCSLSERDGNLLRAGPFFTVQNKSDHEKLIFEKEYEIDWLKRQDNPFFICVSDRKNLSVELFSTWNMHNGFVHRRADKVILVPGKPDDEFKFPETTEDRKEQVIPLGKPFLKVTANDVMEEECVKNCRSVMRDWIEMDRKNIVNRGAEIYWVVGPQRYETNIRLDKKTLALSALYWHGKNLNVLLKNFGRSAAELRLTICHAFGTEHEGEHFPAEQLNDLEQVLSSFAEHLEPVAIRALSDEIGLVL